MKKNKYSNIVLVVFLFFTSIIFAQSIGISGSGTSNINGTHYYIMVSNNVTVYQGSWSVSSGGVIISQNLNSITIRWSSAGTMSVNYSAWSTSAGALYAPQRQVIVSGVAEVPTLPSTPTVVNNCGNSVLTRGVPPNGITWYWQSSSGGTSTSNSATSITRTSGNVYYLRARSNSTGSWSLSRSVNYSIKALPAIPSTPTVANNCGSSVLTRGTSPSGITWYWQSSSGGISTSNSSTSITRTSGSVYYLRARNNTTGCWSSSRSVSYSIKAPPAIPSTQMVINNCGSSVLTRGTSPSGITWYWQSSSGGTSTSNSSTSITRTSGSVYYLRARNNTTGCWSSSRNVSYSIKALPAIPSTQMVINNCGSSVLTRGTSPSGITWYWQSSSGGTSTSNSSTSITRTSGSVYYLRARNNTTGCWSSSRNVSYNISQPSTWYADSDGDGLGDSSTTLSQCGQPSGYVNNSSDQCPTTHGGGAVNGCPEITSSGLSNENYIYTVTPQIAVDNMSQLTENKNALKNIMYFDGLGRAKQSVAIKQSVSEKDIVTHMSYDTFGRQDKAYLPYASTTNNGLIKTGAAGATNSYYLTYYASDLNATTPNPYSKKEFESSPLNRVLEQAAPGNDWAVGNGHTIKFDYQTNTAAEVRLYTVTLNVNYVPTLVGGATYYAAGELYKTITKDENYSGVVTDKNHTTEEFKDKLGRVILKRTYNNEIAHDTYYVYDKYGNLSYVLPPKSEPHTAKPDAIELAELCYQYKYDYRNRLIEKKIPGKGTATNWESIIYDKLDRPVLTQDPVQKAQRKWLFTKYDVFGRVVYTGIYTHTSILTQAQMQAHFNSQNNVTTKMYETKVTSGTGVSDTYYTNNNFPKTNTEILTANYYDNYMFSRAGTATSVSSYGVASTQRLKGLATGSRVKVLTTSNWITTVSYYDEKGRPIYLYSKNDYLQTTDIVKSKFDFVGKVEETTTIHAKTGQNTITTIDKFAYDHTGRLLNQIQHLDNSDEAELINKNYYDELGQLIKKDVGGKAGTDLTGNNSVTVHSTNFNNGSSSPWVKSSNAISMQVESGRLAVTTAKHLNGANGYYDLVAGTTYTISQDVDRDNFIPSLELSIWKGSSKKYSEFVTESGRLSITFTPAESGTYRLNFRLRQYRYSGAPQSFYLDNIFITIESEESSENVPVPALQIVDYTYNIRGWLKQINNPEILGTDLFGFKLNYNTANHGATTLFNGNIAETEWKTQNDNILRWYKYSYDDLNRITQASDNANRYSLSSINYDKNGNITNLNRQGHTNTAATTFGTMDNLVYAYQNNSNKLIKVLDNANDTFGFKDGIDTATEFTYDANGNMLKDLNKGINTNILYNHLNLPTKVTLATGNIQYIYDATGVKQKKIVSTGTNTEYAGNYIYENSVLKFFNQPQGYVEPSGSGFKYVYQFKDHLGNIRLSYQDTDNNGTVDSSEIIEENHFYPFGLKHKGYNNVVNGTHHPYGYANKEEQDELGLKWLDFSARNYDPAIGRWMNLDPLAEQMRRHSPYNYAFDNPIFFIDPDGMKPFGPGDPPSTPDPVGYAKEKAMAFLSWVGSGIESVTSTIGDGLDAVGDAIGSLDEGTQGNSTYTIGSGVVIVGNGTATDTGVRSENPSEDIHIDEEVITAMSSFAKNKFEGPKKGNAAKSFKNGMSDAKKFKKYAGELSGSINSANTTDEASTISTSVSEEIQTKSSDTTITVDNNTLYSVPHGNTGYLQVTNNRTTTVTIPNNQQSIDSTRNAEQNRLNNMHSQVNQSILNLPN